MCKLPFRLMGYTFLEGSLKSLFPCNLANRLSISWSLKIVEPMQLTKQYGLQLFMISYNVWWWTWFFATWPFRLFALYFGVMTIFLNTFKIIPFDGSYLTYQGLSWDVDTKLCKEWTSRLWNFWFMWKRWLGLDKDSKNS